MTIHWTTRPESDSDAVRRILLAAFDTAEEADLVDALRRDPAWVDGLSMLTVDADGEPVGFALLTRCHIGDTPHCVWRRARCCRSISGPVPAPPRSVRCSTPRSSAASTS